MGLVRLRPGIEGGPPWNDDIIGACNNLYLSFHSKRDFSWRSLKILDLQKKKFTKWKSFRIVTYSSFPNIPKIDLHESRRLNASSTRIDSPRLEVAALLLLLLHRQMHLLLLLEIAISGFREEFGGFTTWNKTEGLRDQVVRDPSHLYPRPLSRCETRQC